MKKMTLCELIPYIDPMNQVIIRDINGNVLISVDDPYNESIADVLDGSDCSDCEIIRITPHAHCLVVIVNSTNKSL